MSSSRVFHCSRIVELASSAGLAERLAGLRRPRPTLAVNRIRPLFERGGKALERGVEHRSHQHRQHPASEFIGQEESDVAIGFGFRLERPAVFEIAEWAL